MGRKLNKALMLSLFVCVSCLSQEPSSQVTASVPQQIQRRPTALKAESAVDVLFATNPFIVAPIMCGTDGTIFVRTATSNSVGNLLAITSDGKFTTSFDISKVTDIMNPSPTTFFVRDSDVYMLARGSMPEDKILALKRPDGSTENQRIYASQHFIMRFKRDGSYAGAIPLDLPLVPLQVGVFPDGEFLIAGTTKDRQEARIALASSSGQFSRLIELKDDIRLRSELEDTGRSSPTSLPRTGARFGEGFSEAIQTSSIISDGRNLLLVRKGQKAPVFSISPGGDVKAIHLNVPQGYSLWDIRTTPNLWVALYMHRISDAQGVEFSSMAIHPDTGEILESYAYDRFPGFGFACTDGIEFSFLVRENNKLKILKLLSSHTFSSNKN